MGRVLGLAEPIASSALWSKMITRAEKRALRAIERTMRNADAAWVRETFGEVALPLRDGWLIASLGADLLALVLVVIGLIVQLTVILPGFLVAGIALCMHLERANRRGVVSRQDRL
ncbi:DUF3040 domain-containing protein [Amycolatopsis sp. cmx-4-54]|uniref:DUF3040 domain-containing protein n=1 Tax=Amycolatopsis sp. cmx-4-54 TaxID=2790936 RepID=UPI00397CC706